MAPVARYVKLGLFTVLVASLVVVAVIWVGVRGPRSSAKQYHAYFDNSVQGLDVGAAVKFRGLSIGSVEAVGLAADARHVDVLLGIDDEHAKTLKLDEPNSPVRARAVMLGITGVKIIDLDVAAPGHTGAKKLPFEAPPNTIATAPTMLEGLERELDRMATQLPPLLDGLNKAVSGLSVVVEEVHDYGVVGKVDKAIENASAAAAELHAIAHALNNANLPGNLSQGFEGLNGALAKINMVLDKLGSDGGLVSSAQRATDSFGDLGRSTAASSARLDDTLRDVDEAAKAIRELAIELQQQPDILVKGRARPRR